jgi:transposase
MWLFRCRRNDGRYSVLVEVCGSAHYWARKPTTMGHTVKLMAMQFIEPYVKTNKFAGSVSAAC